jgi:hypothetical protein
MRKRTLRPGEASQITEKTLFKIADDLKRGVPPLPKLSVVDDMMTGLRFIIYKDAEISIHVSYTVGERRPFMKIGSLSPASHSRQPKTAEQLTLAEARDLTRAIKAIGDRGIDIEQASRQRLLSEIKRDGAAWKPALNAPAKK